MPHISTRGEQPVPTVKNFGSYRIMLFAEDHNPPHVHVIGRDFQAKVRIRDAAIFAGMIPPRHRRQALRWVADNRAWLQEKWNELS
jgi:hypothetical protein